MKPLHSNPNPARCLRVGLTGGIACGKSEVERILRERGIPVLDTDKVAHQLMRAGTPVFRAVVEHFGPGILGNDGEIHRPTLGKIVFADSEARDVLNRLVHPAVGQRWREWLREQPGPVAVVSIPLLFECGLAAEFDGVLVVGAPESLMHARLLARGLTPEQAAQRVHAQWPVSRKLNLATWILMNDGTLEDLRERTDRWLRKILAQEQ